MNLEKEKIKKKRVSQNLKKRANMKLHRKKRKTKKKKSNYL